MQCLRYANVPTLEPSAIGYRQVRRRLALGKGEPMLFQERGDARAQRRELQRHAVGELEQPPRIRVRIFPERKSLSSQI